MLAFLAAAATIAAEPPSTVRAAVQARATVRIVRGESIRFTERQHILRESRIRTSDATTTPAKLVEFE